MPTLPSIDVTRGTDTGTSLLLGDSRFTASSTSFQTDTVELFPHVGCVHSLATPPDEIYVLVEDELTSSRMATEIVE
ncbi:hypothetical protein R3X27_18865 [Tropicimonas sp. TH_r6]|uniref:hypothetical protein n=1 Tax=Tropicimonas sp. TH_r6 TaxID=3082085 RepID=UPI002955C9A0|nr:hypothetical protein [Tropicimonas sp. TH_r6]MDV7144748.1 hypothetical protein [Tropicimonas sp. TH_r6]